MRSLVLIAALVIMVIAAHAETFTSRFEAAQDLPTQSVVNRLAQKQKIYHWYELSDSQDQKLRAALKGFHTSRSILILSATGDSLGLAEDFDLAFKARGIKSSIDRPMDTVDGLHCTSLELADLITAATGIKVIVDADQAGPDDSWVLNFGRKVQ